MSKSAKVQLRFWDEHKAIKEKLPDKNKFNLIIG